MHEAGRVDVIEPDEQLAQRATQANHIGQAFGRRVAADVLVEHLSVDQLHRIERAPVVEHDTDMTYPLMGLGQMAYSRGNYEEARAHYERALAIREKALGPDHPSIASSLGDLADIAAAQGMVEEARGYHERGLSILEQAFGPTHPELSDPLTGLADVLLQQGNTTDAIAHLERALTLRASNAGALNLANAQLVLARALWDAPVDEGRDRGRALELAEHARVAYAGAGENWTQELEEAETWQREHLE